MLLPVEGDSDLMKVRVHGDEFDALSEVQCHGHFKRPDQRQEPELAPASSSDKLLTESITKPFSPCKAMIHGTKPKPLWS
jgi:hypothetical protein